MLKIREILEGEGNQEAKEVLDATRLDKEQQYSYNRYLDYLHLKASEALSLKIQQEELIDYISKVDI